jgi:uncharacterized protein YacL
MSPSRRPSGFITETLRVLVVIFGAALGIQLARNLSDGSDEAVLGVLTPTMIGVIVGAGLGYSLGGVLARFMVRAINRGDQAMEGITPDELVSGAIGAVFGGLLAAVISWPIFLVAPPLIAFSVFAFLIILASAFGFTVAQRRRDAVLNAVGRKAGVSPNTRSTHPIRLLDTSIAIDGRFTDVVRAGFALGRLVVCQPVLDELQQLADSSDDYRRAKGRRGLETLETLRRLPGVEISVLPDEAPDVEEVDAKLVQMAIRRKYALLTLDTGLAKVASVSGVQVQNLHALSLALRPPVAVGDDLSLRLIRAGKEAGQAVGYLDDGTMVVVDRAEPEIGNDVDVVITSVLTTSNGRMAFGKLKVK